MLSTGECTSATDVNWVFFPAHKKEVCGNSPCAFWRGFVSCLRLLFALLLITLASTSKAQAPVHTYSIYVNSDGNNATGCSAIVHDRNGSSPVVGAEYLLQIQAGSQTGPVTLAACDAGNSFGAASAIDASLRPTANTPQNGKLIEHLELAVSPGSLNLLGGRAAFFSLASSGDYLVQAAGGAIQFVPAPIQPTGSVSIPAIGSVATFALTVIIAVWGWRSRQRVGNSLFSLVLMGGMAVLVSGSLAWAAVRAISINDGHIADWAGIPPVATDPADDHMPGTPDLLAFYIAESGNQLVFRIDANAGRDDPDSTPGQPVLHGNRDVSPFEKSSGLPRFLTYPALIARAGTPWSYGVKAVDGQGKALAVEVVATESPAGVTIAGSAPEQTVQWTPADAGMHPIVLRVRDANGKTQRQSFLLGVSDDSSLPADPVTRATPIPANVITPFAKSTQFLYDDADPIQEGVAPGVIEPLRAAVLRGQVLDRAGAPLAGVDVRVHGHPEFGNTRTRADGWFDMAVNGGGWLTIHYEKTGYLSAQRKIHTPWRDWAVADDVVLIPVDGQYSQIDLTQNRLQTYWGTENTDHRGTRRTTIVFPAGTQATAELPDGSTQSLSQLTVRVSEYTLGEKGPQTMPGELPTTVGYTWAANFSVDEAQALDATHVRFDRPVYTYTDNFIGAPVGTAVPAGWYDFERTAWIGADNGRVVQILSIEGDKAVLRVTPANRAATESELAQLGITGDELAALAQMYPAGASLWRTPMEHFTPWDCNWPWGPPPDAPPPPPDGPPSDGPPGGPPPPESQPPDPENPDNEDDTDEEEDIECGCDIYVKQRAVGQSIPLRGTAFDLYYRSDRRADTGQPVITPTKIRTRIKSSSGDIHPALKYAQTEFVFAGRKIIKSRNAAQFAFAPQFDESGWDGTDVYGRRISGGVTTLRSAVKYGYSAVYYSAPSDFIMAFETAGSGSGVAFSKGAGQEPVVEMRRAGGERSIKAPPEKSLDVSQANMGGWVLRGMRFYDPDKQLLYEAGGQVKDAMKMAVGIQAISKPIFQNGLGATLLSDGKVLAFSENRLQSYPGVTAASQTAQPFAGEGQAGYGGDGGPASEARFKAIRAVAEAADGSIYISDTGNYRVRRVTPDGIIDTVAGNGANGPSGASLQVGTPVRATEVSVSARSLAPLPDMSVLMVTDLGELLRLTPGGMLVRLEIPPGYRASKTIPSPHGEAWVLLDNLGSDQTYVYKYTKAGILDYVIEFPMFVEAVSGSDDSLIAMPSWGVSIIRPNGSMNILPVSREDASVGWLIGYSQDAGLIVADNWKRMARVSSGLPYSGAEVYLVAKPDGERYEIFDARGLPQTLNSAHTGETLASYQYTLQGYLASVTDAHGNAMKLHRDGNHRITKVVGVDGQETALTYNSQGLLATVVEPGGATHRMVYNGTGLLTEYHDPLGGVDRFSYDASGKLVRNEAPDGSGWALSRDSATNTITATTALGRSKSVQQLVQGEAVSKTTIGFDGTKTTQQTSLSKNNKEISYPDGTSVNLHRIADKLFGAIAPEQSFSVWSDGLSWYTSERRSGQWMGSNFSSRTRTLIENNKVSTTRFENLSYGSTATAINPNGVETKIDFNQWMQPTRVNDPAGGTVNLAYNPRGQLEKIESFADDVATRTTQLQYHPHGSHGAGQIAKVTNPLGQATQYSYDMAGRMTRMALPDGRSATYGYDAVGNLTRLVTPAGNSHGFNYTATHQPAGYAAPSTSTQWEYNRDRQLTRIRRPGGQEITFGYDTGARLTSIDSDAGPIHIAYDAAGRVASRQAPGTRLAYSRTGFALTGIEWSGALNARLDASVDRHGKPIQLGVTAGGAAPVTVPLAYDYADRLAQIGPLSIQHDSRTGLAVGATMGQSASDLRYNGVGELAQARYTGRTHATPESEAARVMLLQKVRSLSAEIITGITERGTCRMRRWFAPFTSFEVPEWAWTYDSPSLDESRRAELIATYGAPQLRNPDYCVETVGRRFGRIESAASRPYTDDSWAEEVRDQTIELRTATAAGAAAIAALGGGSGADLITDSASYNTATVIRLYDEVLQLVDELAQATDRSGFPAQFSYQRDPLGRITAQTEQVDGAERQHAYTYDAAGRLTQHTQDGQPTTWGYDANGNRTHENGAAIASYDSEDRLQAWKGSTYSYTPAGELAQKTSPAGTTRYQYDSLGNLRSVTLSNGNTITYLIDPQNRRIGKQKNGSLEYGLIYQDQLRPIAQTQPNGTIRSIFLYGETHAPEGMLRDGKVYRLIGDHLGSVRMVIDADTGDVAQRMDYDAWGKITYDSNPGFQPFGYAGGIYDPDTGLTRFGARDYDAEVGRWTAKDPILFRGGDTNLYGYVLQDPINWIDPDGRARFGGRGKGERGRTARPDGTGNPYKHTRPDPTDPTKILQKDADGKWIKKAKPEGYDEAIKRKQKGEVLPELLEWFLLPWVLTPSELGCSTMDCHYTWDECEKTWIKNE